MVTIHFGRFVTSTAMTRRVFSNFGLASLQTDQITDASHDEQGRAVALGHPRNGAGLPIHSHRMIAVFDFAQRGRVAGGPQARISNTLTLTSPSIIETMR